MAGITARRFRASDSEAGLVPDIEDESVLVVARVAHRWPNHDERVHVGSGVIGDEELHTVSELRFDLRDLQKSMQWHHTIVRTALPLPVGRAVEAVVPPLHRAVISPYVAGDDVLLAKSAPAPMLGLGLLLLLYKPRLHLVVVVELDAFLLEELEKSNANEFRGYETD